MTEMMTSLPVAVHELAEYEVAAAYARGYEAGRAESEAEIQATANRIATSPHPPYLSPSAEKVIRDLAERMAIESRPTPEPPAVSYGDRGWPAPTRPGGESR